MCSEVDKSDVRSVVVLAWGSGISKGFTSRSVIMYMQCGNDRRYHKFQAQSSLNASSHLVKHTADVLISSLRPPRMIVVVMHLGTPHAHVRWSGWCCQPGRIGNPRCTWTAWPCHVGAMIRCNCLTVRDFRHPPDAATAQPRVLVAVAPAVDGSLDETALSPKAWIQLCERPSYRVAFRLVVQAVALILVLGAACARVDAVLTLELLGQLIDIDGLNVAADGIFHLDSVARVFKRDPLNAVLILLDNKRCSGRNGTRCSIRVHICACSGGARMHIRSSSGRNLIRRLRGSSQTRGRAL